MSLKQYQAKRNFKQTAEPAGKDKARQGRGGRLRFVVQKHAASHLHYDFRLAMKGVLKSWAVPKGFPTRRGDRRLAVQVEDHPLDYAKFEGTIAPGNYGAGTVMVWDTGSYEVLGAKLPQALEQGKLHFILAGTKLKGEWTLVRMRPRADTGRTQWLLLKSGDDLRPISPRADDRSALSGRSLKQIASAGGPQWKSNRQTAPAKPAKDRNRTLLRTPSVGKSDRQISGQFDNLPRAKAEFIEPMKCRLAEELPKGAKWIYEIKFDGIRALTIKTARSLSLISRNKKDFTEKYRPVADTLKGLPCREAVLDGEIVAVDAQGRSSFQLLQAAGFPGRDKPPILYYVFDLLNLDGRDLTGLPLEKRKETLKSLLAGVSETVFFSASISGESGRVIKAMKARGLEGVVAKQRDSRYQAGQRSGAWVKFKWTLEQEFVIGGFTRPRGGRAHFGAILVGYYHGGNLLFASKVGAGFDQALLESLHEQFGKLIRRDCPFANLSERRGILGAGLTAAEMRRCTWIEPRLVCEVRFSEWTRDGHLRQPVFLGLREDKQPREVIRELPK